MTTQQQYPPKTPPRRLGRRTHLTPSKTPYVTPSKTPQQLAPRSLHRQYSGASPFALSTGRGGVHGNNSNHNNNSNSRHGSSYSSSSTSKADAGGDRFIPSRRHMSMDLSRRALLNSAGKRSRNEDNSSSGSSPRTSKPCQETPLQKEFKRRMLSSMCNIPLDKLNEDAQPAGILSFGGGGSSSASASSSSQQPFQTPQQPDPFALDFLRTVKLGGVSHDTATEQSVASKVVRKVSSAPIRILDAPDVVDDYYLNLISWSKDNILAVALARSVYLWNAVTGEIHHLLTVEEGNNYITSVNWCDQPGHTHYIAVGTNSAVVHLYDGRDLRLVRTMTGHTSRVSALAWVQNRLTSGGRDSLILNHDVRVARNVVSTYKAHTQEVCGLKWNEDGSCLASGGNENFLCLWDAAMSSYQANRRRRAFMDNSSATTGTSSLSEHDVGPRLLLKHHKAAVKALDWCPFHRGLLASGGGTADRTIKFWNTSSGAILNSIDTGSQVCSILWSKHQRELCSSHGYSENQLILWKYPSMTKIKELKGHTARVLNMDMSPDGTSVVSAGADETLRFWNVFEDGGSSVSQRTANMLVGDLLGGPTIR